MSICPEPDVCSLYVDGELCKDERVNFERHVQECSECKNNMNSYLSLKRYIGCTAIPELDLNKSFDKLLLKQSLKKSFLLYRLFHSWKKSKMVFNVSIATFLFALVFLSVLSIQNKINLTDSDEPFKPIIPIAYESHLPIELNNLRFSTINVPFNTARKMDAKTYKNMANTFNGFTNLYSNLEHGEGCVCSRIPIINRNRIVNYSTDIPFYRSLNKK